MELCGLLHIVARCTYNHEACGKQGNIKVDRLQRIVPDEPVHFEIKVFMCLLWCMHLQ